LKDASAEPGFDRRRFIGLAGRVLAAAAALFGVSCEQASTARRSVRVFFEDRLRGEGRGLGDAWMSVRHESRAYRDGGRATIEVDPAPGRVLGGRPFAEYLGDPFVVGTHVDSCAVSVDVRLDGRVEAGPIARWVYDRAYALLVTPAEVLLCRYSTTERAVLDRVAVRGPGWYELTLTVTGGRLSGRARAAGRTYELKAADPEPLGPGLVGVAVNSADAERRVRAEFRSFVARSSEEPGTHPPAFAYAFCGAVVPAPSGGYRARLSARTVIPGPVAFEVAGDEAFSEPDRLGPFSPEPGFGAVRAWASGLAQGQTYYWRPVVQSGEGDVRGATRRFRTPPPAGGPVRIAFASCTSGRVASYPSFGVAASFDPDLYLHAGDWGYANLNSLAHRGDHFQARWTRLLRERNVDELVTKTSLLFWQDDHDYQSDNGWSETVKRYAVEAFDEIHANPTDDYFDIRWGDVHAFCLDCRLHATDPRAPDDARKSRLGPAQRAWLERELRSTDAPVVLIAAPMAFRNKTDDDPGWHNVYTHERDELLGLFSSLDATVVILSGDAHGHRLIHHREFGELYEVTASGTDFPATIGWGQGNHDPGHTLVNIVDRTGFALVDLDPAGPGRRLTVRSIATEDGSTMFERSFVVRA
jgi:hypothetical protein